MSDLPQAIESADIGRVWKLIQDGTRLDDVDPSSELTPLALAAETGSTEIVRMLLAAGANPSQGGLTTPLEAAVVGGHIEVTKALLETTVDVNHAVDEGFTPLMTAAVTGSIPLVRLLLEVGARPRAANDTGDTAISLAEGEGHEAIVKLLKAKRSRKRKETPEAVQTALPPKRPKRKRSPAVSVSRKRTATAPLSRKPTVGTPSPPQRTFAAPSSPRQASVAPVPPRRTVVAPLPPRRAASLARHGALGATDLFQRAGRAPVPPRGKGAETRPKDDVAELFGLASSAPQTEALFADVFGTAALGSEAPTAVEPGSEAADSEAFSLDPKTPRSTTRR